MSYCTKLLRPAFLVLAIAIAIGFFGPSISRAEDKPKSRSKDNVPVEVVADNIQYDKDHKKITGKGNVVVTYKQLKLQADQAEVFTDTKKAHAEGHVTVFDGSSTLSGDKGDYDLGSHSGSFANGTGYQYPWYAKGEEIEQISKDEIRIKNGKATTCNLERPHYDIIAKNVTVYPNDKIVLRNAFFRILGKKVFWIPYLTIPLDDRHSPIEIKTGYSSNYGFYVMTAKDFSLSKDVKLKGHVDYRTKRGIAGGADLSYHLKNFGRGKIITYVVDDKRAPTPVISGTDNPFANRRKKTRYRLSIRHRTDFEPRTNLIVNWHELSDEFLIQEFFQREDHRESKPRSQAVLTRTRDDYGMFAEMVKRSNHFFSELEKLPRFNFVWKNQPLFDTDLLYKHETQFTHFQRKIARSTSLHENVVRVDTTHEIQYPFQIMDSRVKVTPYVNAREALYSRGRFSNSNHARGLLGDGIEARTRFQRTFDYSTNFMKLEINKLRHILEPIVRYDAIRLDTFHPEKLLQMDEFDALHNHNTVTFALDNRLQTKRKRDNGDQRVDIVSYNTFANYEFGGGRNGGSGLTDWGHQVTVRPYDWLLFEAHTTFDFTLQDIRESLVDVVLEPTNERVRLILSQGFLRQDPSIPGSEGSDIVAMDLMVKINELWKAGGYLRADFKSGDVQEWEIRAIRDLHDFLLTFGVNIRDSDFRAGKGRNKEVFVELRMKAFPEVSLGVGNRASFVKPRIGRYYNGSNAEESFPSEYYGAF